MMNRAAARDARPDAQMRPARTVIAPLDGTPCASLALPVASALADLEDAVLHVVHVGERVVPPAELVRDLGLAPDQLRGTVLDQATGSPAQGILQLAAHCAEPVLVLCSHTGAEKPAGSLGRVAEEILCESSLPMILVPPDREFDGWRLRRILLPHDGTPTAAAAIGPAADLAARAGVELIALHVAQAHAAPPAEPGTFAVPRYVDQPQHEWPAWAAEFTQRLRGIGHPPAAVRLRLAMAAGEPGTEIVRFAREHEADLIVMAWHGDWSPPHARTMRAVIRDAPCPVLVLRIAPAE